MLDRRRGDRSATRERRSLRPRVHARSGRAPRALLRSRDHWARLERAHLHGGVGVVGERFVPAGAAGGGRRRGGALRVDGAHRGDRGASASGDVQRSIVRRPVPAAAPSPPCAAAAPRTVGERRSPAPRSSSPSPRVSRLSSRHAGEAAAREGAGGARHSGRGGAPPLSRLSRDRGSTPPRADPLPQPDRPDVARRAPTALPRRSGGARGRGATAGGFG